jgi:hypothetical protein
MDILSPQAIIMGGDEEHQVVTGLVRVDEHRLPLWCSSVVVGAFATSSMLSKMGDLIWCRL